MHVDAQALLIVLAEHLDRAGRAAHLRSPVGHELRGGDRVDVVASLVRHDQPDADDQHDHRRRSADERGTPARASGVGPSSRPRRWAGRGTEAPDRSPRAGPSVRAIEASGVPASMSAADAMRSHSSGGASTSSTGSWAIERNRSISRRKSSSPPSSDVAPP